MYMGAKLITLLICFILIAGCTRKTDEPPAYTGPDIHPTISIADLRAKHSMGSQELLTDEDIIEGIVVADDRSGNFYKIIVLQDSTGGIQVKLDGYNLFNHFPVGCRLAIKLKNLWMADYGRMIQLGAGIDRTVPTSPELVGIPLPMFSRYLIKKSLHNILPLKDVRIDQLGDSLQSCLVRISNVEFSVTDTGTTYADALNQLADNKTVKACSGGSVYLRSSGFADFAAVKTPRGNGSITAVYGVFGTAKQLLIRDTADVQLNGLRCTGTGPKLLFSEDFEKAITGADITLQGWKNIAETGGQLFKAKMLSQNSYAEISGAGTGQSAIVSWLISPPVNLSNSANEVLQFQTRDAFDNGANFQVLVSVNYDGGNTPWKAKWTVLKAQFSKGSVNGISPSWAASGPISLSGFQGNVYVAFRYEGADPSAVIDKRTTTFQVDNIRIEGN